MQKFQKFDGAQNLNYFPQQLTKQQNHTIENLLLTKILSNYVILFFNSLIIIRINNIDNDWWYIHDCYERWT